MNQKRVLDIVSRRGTSTALDRIDDATASGKFFPQKVLLVGFLYKANDAFQATDQAAQAEAFKASRGEP